MTRIVIESNASANKVGVTGLVASLILIMAVIAAGFAWFGLWLIAPFCGLEVVFLIAVFGYLSRHGRRKQVISIDSDEVRIEDGIESPECSTSFRRAWVQVVLEPARTRGYPSRLFLRSVGKQVRIGEMLSDSERSELARRLRHLIATSDATV